MKETPQTQILAWSNTRKIMMCLIEKKKHPTTSQKKILRKIPSLPISLHIKIRNRQINANTLLLILETGWDHGFGIIIRLKVVDTHRTFFLLLEIIPVLYLPHYQYINRLTYKAFMLKSFFKKTPSSQWITSAKPRNKLSPVKLHPKTWSVSDQDHGRSKFKTNKTILHWKKTLMTTWYSYIVLNKNEYSSAAVLHIRREEYFRPLCIYSK